MATDYDQASSTVSFDGKDGEDVSGLLRSVKRVALAEGQQGNEVWLIHFTESCLGGAALRWFLDLDQSVQQSWPALQKALLRRFEAEHVTTISQAVPPACRPSPATGYIAPLPFQFGSNVFTTLILGDAGVGKSCLLARFTNQIWAPYTTPTTGVDYVMGHFVYNDRVYEEHLWDPSGSEQYDDVRQKYYKGVKSFWLVYDVTNRQSFENIRKWTASVRQLATNMKSAYLFGCKADMDNKRAVWPAEAEALSKELRLKWAGEMSAKTNQGIQKQFGSRAQVLKSVSIR